MDNEGGIMVPENIRIQLGIRDNDKLLVSVVDGTLFSKPVRRNE